MARRLVNTTIKNQKDTFDFELWDMESDATNLDHTVEFDINGFEISWKGDTDDVPIMGSTMNWSMFLDEAQRSAIMPVVFSDTEFRMCVRVKQGNNVFWCGVVHAEGTSEVIGDGIITVSLQASDGLGMLKNMDWLQEDGNRYTGKVKLRDAIWGAISRLPHISLLGGTGTPVLQEHALNRPITQAASELFLHGPIGGIYYGVMDYMKLNPNTFYYSTLEDERAVGGKSFGSKDKFNPDDFTSCNLVLTDIMSSLGATICFAEGRFHVWDKTQQFMTAYNDTYKSIEWYITDSNVLDTDGGLVSGTHTETHFDRKALSYAGTTAYNNHPRYDFLRGAALKAEHSVRGVTQNHKRAGSDLIYANGIGYHDSSTPSLTSEHFNTPLIELRRKDAANDVDGDSSPTDVYKGFFGAGSQTTYDGLLDTRNRERHITDIQIPNGTDDGEFRLHLSGNANYHKNNVAGNASAYGNLAIYKQRVEVNDGTNWYRLSRPVRTLRYDSTGADADVNIDGSGAGRYSPKLYENLYEWIIDTDARYDDAWLDIPMGANNQIVEEGQTSKFLQQDYPDVASGAGFYTPPLTKIKAGDNDNTLEKDNDRDVYIWRHDFQYEMPAASGVISEIKIQQPVLEEWNGIDGPNLLYDSSGNTLDIGTNYLDPTYRTKTTATATDGYGNKPNSLRFFQLSGVEVMFGDGTRDFDQNCVAYPTTTRGREILNLKSTRLGASFNNTGNSTTGRYVASDYTDPTADEDNLKFARPYDATFKKESLAEMVTTNMLELRGKVRKTINYTSILAHDDAIVSDQKLMPYSRLVTDTLDTTTAMIIPYSISYTMTEGSQRVEGWIKPASAEANVGSTNETEDDSSRGPLPSLGNFEKPSGVDLSDFTFAEATDDTGGTGTGSGGKFGDLFPMFIRRL